MWNWINPYAIAIGAVCGWFTSWALKRWCGWTLYDWYYRRKLRRTVERAGPIILTQLERIEAERERLQRARP